MPQNTAKIKIIVEGAPNARQQIEKLKQATDKANQAQKGYTKGAENMRGVTAGLQRDIGRLRNVMLLYSFAIGAIITKINRLVEVYRVQAEAEKLLENNLSNVAGMSERASTRLTEYAASLQKATTFGDEQIISAMSLLATFQLTEATIAQLTPRVLDMAAATGQDLNSAAIMAGKAVTGQASALSRTGVVLDKFALSTAQAAGPAQEFAFLMGELDKNFAGAAEALAQTPLGKLDQLRNKIGDVEEQIGATSLPVAHLFSMLKLGVLEFGSTYAKAFEIASTQGVSFTTAIALARIELEGIGVASEQLKEAGKTLDNLEKSFKRINDQLKFRQQLNLLYTEDLLEAGNVDEERIDKLARQHPLENQLFDLRLAQTAHQKEADALAAAGQEQSLEHQSKGIQLAIKRKQVEIALADAKVKATTTMLGSFAALNTAAAGDAKVSARLAQIAATIDMFAGANKALAQGGFFGIAMAASVIAAGMANIVNIEKQMANMGKAALGADFVTSGPQMLLVGEQGRERVNVTPLEGPNVLGGQTGNVNITFTGNVLSNEFVMDEVLPQIREAAQINLA